MDVAPGAVPGNGYVRLRRDPSTTSELDTMTVIKSALASPPAGSYTEVNPGMNNDVCTVYTTAAEYNQLIADMAVYRVTVIVERTGATMVVYVAHVRGAPLFTTRALEKKKQVSEFFRAFNLFALRKDIDYVLSSLAELLQLARAKREPAVDDSDREYFDSEPPGKPDELAKIVS